MYFLSPKSDCVGMRPCLPFSFRAVKKTPFLFAMFVTQTENYKNLKIIAIIDASITHKEKKP